MRIERFRRRPNRVHDRLFDDLPPDVRWRAEGWLAKFVRRWGGNLPSWRYPILIGQARRLAWTTPEQRSQWGRRMLARLAGQRTQELYRHQGRTGSKHPAQQAARASANLRRLRNEDKLRDAMGLPPKTRHKHLPLY